MLDDGTAAWWEEWGRGREGGGDEGSGMEGGERELLREVGRAGRAKGREGRREGGSVRGGRQAGRQEARVGGRKGEGKGGRENGLTGEHAAAEGHWDEVVVGIPFQAEARAHLPHHKSTYETAFGWRGRARCRVVGQEEGGGGGGAAVRGRRRWRGRGRWKGGVVALLVWWLLFETVVGR